MSVRVHRKRLILFGLLVICILVYFNDYYIKYSNPIVPEQFVEIDGKKLRKIDWHDYTLIERENARIGNSMRWFFMLESVEYWLGLGEGGNGVEPTVAERNTAVYHELYRANGFNAFVSNQISLDRSLNDLRHSK